MPAPIPKSIDQLMPTVQNVAQTSHYLVQFGLPPSTSSGSGGLKEFLRSKGVDDRFHLGDVGLLCSAAVLPGSTFANTVVTGEFQGVVETIPHTRNFTRISLEFYVDDQYRSIKFLEHWMEYISRGSSADPTELAYRFQLNYPAAYRSNSTKIIKFEKNYRQYLEYNFVGLFPIALNSTRVTYQNSDVLKATCSFAFERYVCGELSSISKARNTDQNKTGSFNRFAGNDPGYNTTQGMLDRMSAMTSGDTNPYDPQNSLGSFGNILNFKEGTQFSSGLTQSLSGMKFGSGTVIGDSLRF